MELCMRFDLLLSLSHLTRCSILVPWLVFEASAIQMSKLTRMGCLFGISKLYAYSRNVRILIVYRQVDPDMSDDTKTLLPWYLGYNGDNDAIQCMTAGSNGYKSNQAALNHGLNNHWATNNTPWSWGYYKRDDIPVQFAIADGWTTGDMYQVSLIFSVDWL